MTFLEAVNRVLRLEGILDGDDEAIETFNDNAFAAATEQAQLAIQDVLIDLMAQEFIPAEDADSTVTLATDTRVVALASDFVRFRDSNPFLLEVDGSGNSLGNRLEMYPGGEEALRRHTLDYRENSGPPSWFYFDRDASTKQIGFYPVPDSGVNGKIYRYYYQARQTLEFETDTVPFVADQEAQAFTRICARRFKYLHTSADARQQLYPNGIIKDAEYLAAYANLMALLRPHGAQRGYGRRYG